MRAYTGVRKCPFHNLALATIRSDKKSSASSHPTSRDGVLFESRLRVIHLRQIRFDRSSSLIHVSRIQKSERAFHLDFIACTHLSFGSRFSRSPALSSNSRRESNRNEKKDPFGSIVNGACGSARVRRLVISIACKR